MLHTIQADFLQTFFAPKGFLGSQKPFSYSTSCLESSLELPATSASIRNPNYPKRLKFGRALKP